MKKAISCIFSFIRNIGGGRFVNVQPNPEVTPYLPLVEKIGTLDEAIDKLGEIVRIVRAHMRGKKEYYEQRAADVNSDNRLMNTKRSPRRYGNPYRDAAENEPGLTQPLFIPERPAFIPGKPAGETNPGTAGGKPKVETWRTQMGWNPEVGKAYKECDKECTDAEKTLATYEFSRKNRVRISEDSIKEKTLSAIGKIITSFQGFVKDDKKTVGDPLLGAVPSAVEDEKEIIEILARKKPPVDETPTPVAAPDTAQTSAPEETAPEAMNKSRIKENVPLFWDDVIRKLVKKGQTGEEQPLTDDERWALMYLESGKTVTRTIDGTRYVLEKDRSGNYLRLKGLTGVKKKEPARELNMKEYLASAKPEMLITGRKERTPVWMSRAETEETRDEMAMKNKEYQDRWNWFIAENTLPGSMLVLETPGRGKYTLYRRADGKIRTTAVVLDEHGGEKGKPKETVWTDSAKLRTDANEHLFRITAISPIEATLEQAKAAEKEIQEERLAGLKKITDNLALYLSMRPLEIKPVKKSFAKDADYQEAMITYKHNLAVNEEYVQKLKQDAFDYLRRNPIDLEEHGYRLPNQKAKVMIQLVKRDKGPELIATGRILYREEMEKRTKEGREEVAELVFSDEAVNGSSKPQESIA